VSGADTLHVDNAAITSRAMPKHRRDRRDCFVFTIREGMVKFRATILGLLSGMYRTERAVDSTAA